MGDKNRSEESQTREWEQEGEPLDQEWTDRIVVLKNKPLPRKVQLMAGGVKEIRCTCCVRVRPIDGAEELGDGWICEDCLLDAMDKRRYGGQRGE